MRTELLLADGGAEISGKFLFRARTGTDEHVLSVIYKAQGTHHKVATGAGGDLEINGQPTGCTDLAQVTTTHRALPTLPANLVSCPRV